MLAGRVPSPQGWREQILCCCSGKERLPRGRAGLTDSKCSRTTSVITVGQFTSPDFCVSP